jgi:hypothetical protein
MKLRAGLAHPVGSGAVTRTSRRWLGGPAATASVSLCQISTVTEASFSRRRHLKLKAAPQSDRPLSRKSPLKGKVIRRFLGFAQMERGFAQNPRQSVKSVESLLFRTAHATKNRSAPVNSSFRILMSTLQKTAESA